MTGVQLPARSINRALRASHERLVSDVLVPGDPDYPFPGEGYLEFVLIRLENSWDRERERATWTISDPEDEMAASDPETAQAGLGDFA